MVAEEKTNIVEEFKKERRARRLATIISIVVVLALSSFVIWQLVTHTTRVTTLSCENAVDLSSQRGKGVLVPYSETVTANYYFNKGHNHPYRSTHTVVDDFNDQEEAEQAYNELSEKIDKDRAEIIVEGYQLIAIYKDSYDEDDTESSDDFDAIKSSYEEKNFTCKVTE